MIFVASTTSSACVKLFQLWVKFHLGKFKDICVAFGKVGVKCQESAHLKRTLVFGCLNLRLLSPSMPKFTNFSGKFPFSLNTRLCKRIDKYHMCADDDCQKSEMSF